MAQQQNGGDDILQKKLFGPFRGLNNTKSPLLRSTPPNPYQAAEEYATDFKNLIIDSDFQDLVLRNGIEFVERGSAASDNSTYVATSGLFKWIDYDSFTGKPTERAVQLSITQAGVPTLIQYTRILTEVTLSDSTYSGKSYAIIEDPDNAYAKRFVIYNSGGSVAASASAIGSLSHTAVNYINYNANIDGSIIANVVDLVPPTVITFNSSSGPATQVVQFMSLAKKTVSASDLNLSSWISTLATNDATFFTGVQASNILYLSNGVNAILKYDGQSLYKAGMPNSGIKGSVVVDQSSLSLSAYITALGISTVDELLGFYPIHTSGAPDFFGNFAYMHTYQRGDAKNNTVEGVGFLKGSYNTFGVDNTPVPTSPPTLTITQGNNAHPVYTPFVYWIGNPPTTTVFGAYAGLAVYTAPSLVQGDGYDARAAQIASTIVIAPTLPTTDFTIDIGSGSQNTLKIGDILAIRATFYPTVPSSIDSDSQSLPILITCRLKNISGHVLTIDYTYPISVQIINGGNALSSAGNGGLLADITKEQIQALLTAAASLTTWKQLFTWDWLGLGGVSTNTLHLTSDFVISNNLVINIYRNRPSLDGYDPINDTDGNFIPSLYLLNTLPNNPFSATTSMGTQFDNCRDANLGALYQTNAKLTLELEDTQEKDLTDPDYSSLPKGFGISAFKDRVYLTNDPQNVNILWRSSTLFGTEWFDVGDTLSMETQKGDQALITVGNENIVYVLKDQSVKTIINDLSNEDIRVDDYVIGKYGCIAPRSAQPINRGVAYLSENGPVLIQIENDPEYLGQNTNNISRIKDRMSNPRLDLPRAVAWVDTYRSLYILYIPEISRTASGIFNPVDAVTPLYVNQGETFVYDYANDVWMEWTGINAKGGMCDLNGHFFYLTVGSHNLSNGTSGLEWALYKERDYGNLWSFADYVDLAGTLTLQPIPYTYSTDWLGMDDQQMLKKFLRCRVTSLNQFDDITVIGTGGTTSAATGEFTVDIEANKDWREDYAHSNSSVTLGDGVLESQMKCRGNKAQTMRFSLTGGVLYNSPRIQSIAVEAAEPFKGRLKRWSTP